MTSELSEKLKDAIFADDAASIERLIRLGVDAEYEYYWMYPIHAACFGRRFNAIRALAEAGVDLNIIDWRQQRPPVARAAEENKVEVVKLLLELGADPDVREDNTIGHTPLHIALHKCRSPESAEVLVKHGADVFAKDWSGNTSLRRAVYFECEDVVEVMVERDGRKAMTAARIARRDFRLIACAANRDHSGVDKAIDQKADINTLSPFGESALHYAARYGDNPLVKKLLRHGANPRLQVENWRKTALLEAADSGHLETVKILLKAGSNLLEEFLPGEQLSGGRDMNAVVFAGLSGNIELYEYLKEKYDKLEAARKTAEKKQRDPGGQNKAGRPKPTKKSVGKAGAKKTAKKKAPAKKKTATVETIAQRRKTTKKPAGTTRRKAAKKK